MTKTNENVCACEKTSCDCAAPATARCTCGERCACKGGSDCGCGEAKR